MGDWSSRAASGPAADLWKRTLSQIPTHFGRLVFIANLRDAGGRYVYTPLAESIGREVTERLLLSSHHGVFTEWISSSLAAQKADLEQFLRESGSAVALARYQELMPAGAHEVERQLYITDLETLLSMLRYASGAVSVTRIA